MPQVPETSVYTDDVLGDAMAIFDRLPSAIRNQLNDGIITQLAPDMPVLEQLLRRRGEAEVLRILHEADHSRQTVMVKTK